jgi:signal transduction histidine kinase
MASVAALILFGLTIGAYVFSEAAARASNTALSAASADRAIGRVLEALLDAETGQRGFLLTQDPSYLIPYETAHARFQEDIDSFQRQVADMPTVRGEMEYAELIAVAHKKFTELERTVTLAKAGDFAGATALVKTGVGKVYMDQVRAFAGALHGFARDIRQSYAEELRSNTRYLTLSTVGGVVAVVLISLIALRVVFTHTRQLESAQIALAQMNDDLEQRVQARTEGLKRANDEIQRYAYIVSHDLRAPLVNIIGFTSELATATTSLTDYLSAVAVDPNDTKAVQARIAATEDIPEALEFIRSSSTRMDALINEILKLSRLGRVTLVPERVDVKAVVLDCIANNQHRLDAAGATAEVSGRLPAVVSDVSMLQQIFANLLDNAVKYLDAGRPGRILVRGRLAGPLAIFDIEDNGRGIAPSDHERVFELFRRSGAQDRPGEGIGLAHVRTLARRLGGDITLESDGVSGTTFRLMIASDLRSHMRNQAS